MSLNSGFIMWSPGVTLEAIEKQVILKASDHFRNNKTQTAAALGISIRTLDAKLLQYFDEAKKEVDDESERRQQREAHLARSRGPTTGYDTNAPVSHKADAGIRQEPIANTPAKPSVPVPEREKVQSVLPKQAASGHSRKSG